MFYPDHTNLAFRDFNISGIWDPNLRRGPSFESLFRLVYEARQGDRSGSTEFGDTMYFTLRPIAFDAYQRKHGPFAFTYAEWFYAKLMMFFEILLYDHLYVIELDADQQFQTRAVEQPWKDGVTGIFSRGDWIDPREIEQTLIPEDNERIDWSGVAHEVSAAKTNRTGLLQEILRRQLAARVASTRRPPSWEKNRERDEIIVRGLERKMERAKICTLLDKRKIMTIVSLQELGFTQWADGWQDQVGRQMIQQLFSKRLSAVKARTLSK